MGSGLEWVERAPVAASPMKRRRLSRSALLALVAVFLLVTGAWLDRLMARRFGASWWGSWGRTGTVELRGGDAAEPGSPQDGGSGEGVAAPGESGVVALEELVPLRVLPAEFGELEALLIGCARMFDTAPGVFVDVVAALRGVVPLVGLVNDAKQAEAGRALLRGRGVPPDAVRFLRLPTETMWVRDFGPLFVARDDGLWGIVDASYSGFEAPPERWRDDELPILVANLLDLPLTSLPVRLEWGNFLSNGTGNVITSTKMFGANEDRGFDAEEIGGLLFRELGVEQWTFLRPVNGELTGHVDMFVALLDEDLCVVAESVPAHDPELALILDQAASVLAEVETAVGPMRVHRIPSPPRDDEGRYRTYTNVIIANGVMLVPSFAGVDPALESAVHAIYRELTPRLRIVPVRVDPMLPTGGFLHCFTLPVPKGVDLGGLAEREIPPQAEEEEEEAASR